MKKFKLRYLFLSLALAASITTVSLTSCSTPQQTTTYNTLYSLESGTTAAYSAYLGLVIGGSVATNSLPSVSKAFNDFQAAMALAIALNQNNTNALAPANLAVEAADVMNIINTAKAGGK